MGRKIILGLILFVLSAFSGTRLNSPVRIVDSVKTVDSALYGAVFIGDTIAKIPLDSLKGPKGDDGTSVRILGTVADSASLPTSGNIAGDSYLVDGDLYMWTGTDWVNVGNIQGPQGEQGIQGPTGATGATGPQGEAGPNLVSTSTATNITGILKGNGSNVSAAVSGTDYQAPVTGGASTITSSNLTTNRALVSNSSGKVAVSAITSTELGYIDGVTSNVQTQLNGKEPTITGGLVTQFWNGLKNWVSITIANITGLSDTISNHRTDINSKFATVDTNKLAQKTHTQAISTITGLSDTITNHRNSIALKLNISDTVPFARDGQAMTPTAHASTHLSGGSDQLFDQNLNKSNYAIFNGISSNSKSKISSSDFDVLRLFRNTSTAAAGIFFEVKNNLGDTTVSVRIMGGLSNVTDGSEQGYFYVDLINGATYKRMLKITNNDVTIDGNNVVSGRIKSSDIPALGSTATNYLTSNSGVVSSRTIAQVLSDIGGQPLDATLTALAGLNSTAGFVYQTGSDAFTKYPFSGSGSANSVARSDHGHSGTYEPVITGTANRILKIQSDGTGVTTSSISDDGTNIIFTNTGYNQFRGPLYISGLPTSVTSFLTDNSYPIIYSTGTNGGSYPFNTYSHLIIQARTDAKRDILFVSGTTPEIKMKITPDSVVVNKPLTVHNTAIVNGNLSLSGDIHSTYPGGLSIYANGSEVLRIRDHKLGVNNTNPDSTLTVTGGANISGGLKVGSVFRSFSDSVQINKPLQVHDSLNIFDPTYGDKMSIWYSNRSEAGIIKTPQYYGLQFWSGSTKYANMSELQTDFNSIHFNVNTNNIDLTAINGINLTGPTYINNNLTLNGTTTTNGPIIFNRADSCDQYGCKDDIYCSLKDLLTRVYYGNIRNLLNDGYEVVYSFFGSYASTAFKIGYNLVTSYVKFLFHEPVVYSITEITPDNTTGDYTLIPSKPIYAVNPYTTYNKKVILSHDSNTSDGQEVILMWNRALDRGTYYVDVQYGCSPSVKTISLPDQGSLRFIYRAYFTGWMLAN